MWLLILCFYTVSLDEDPSACNQNAGVRQSARISFSDNAVSKRRAKRGSLSAQVLEKNTAAANADDERIVEGQVSSTEPLKIEGSFLRQSFFLTLNIRYPFLKSTRLEFIKFS